MSDLPWLGHGAELPQLHPGPNIKCARVARPAYGARRCVRPDDDDVLVDQRHGIVRNHHVDFAGRAETGIGHAGPGVERNQPTTGREDDARLLVPFAGPIRDAAPRRCATGDLVLPDLVARLRVERNDAVRRGQIHHPVDDDRRGL